MPRGESASTIDSIQKLFDTVSSLKPSKMIEGARFREHCRQWNQCQNEDAFIEQQRRFTPIFAMPMPVQQSLAMSDQHDQRSPSYIGHPQRQYQQAVSNVLGYPCRPPANQRSHDHSSQNCSVDGGRAWSHEGRQRKSSTSASSLSGFPPRKTLIDTFVERNDDYWKNRVTIKIDVSHTDHSHIIGKQGRNTQQVMKETACHIHFPDANRNPDLEKSNMVSIAGPMQMVDKARRAIRELAPLVVTLELKDCADDAYVISEHPLVRDLAVVYGLNILVRSNRSSGIPFVVVRASVNQTRFVHEVVVRLQMEFMKTTNASCSLALDVLKPQQPSVIGRDGANIKLISERTGATIHYPRDLSGQATTFFIRGPIDAILSARQHILGCLPLAFTFEITKDDVLARLDELQREFGLSISARQNRQGESLIILVKGQERQATQIYAIRRRLVSGVLPEEPAVIADDYEFMRDFAGTGYVPSPNMDVAAPAAPGAPAQLDRTVSGPAGGVFTFQPHPLSNLYSPVSAPWFSNAEDQNHFVYPSTGQEQSSEPAISSSFSRLSAAASSSVGSGATNNESSASSSNFSPTKQSAPSSSYDPLPEEAPLASSLLEAKKKIEAGDATWKAPGAERVTSNDYEQQQALAAKAKREKPHGPRIPTNRWSGLGFSRSMASGATMSVQNKTYATVVASPSKKKLDTSDEDKIGPWTITPAAAKLKTTFNATTYFDNSSGTGLIEGLFFEDTEDVSEVLTKLKLTKYIDIFQEQEVDMATFLTMSDTDLKELGVNTFGARRKLLVVISKLKELKDSKENRRLGQ